MFAQKTKALFLDATGHEVFAMRGAPTPAGLRIEEVKEFPSSVSSSELRAFAEARGRALVRARVGIRPPGRFLARATLDPKRHREPAYLRTLAFPDREKEAAAMRQAVLYAQSGLRFDPDAVFQKEVVVCGAPAAEIDAEQARLVALGLYPERLELASVAVVAGLLDFLRFRPAPGATLLLEILPERSELCMLANGTVDVTRGIPSGLDSVLPVVRDELGLRDTEAAAKIFFSSSFDFTTMADQLLKRLVKDLQSALGLYEVQTGVAVTQLLVPNLRPNLSWVERALGASLGLSRLEIDFPAWLQSAGVTLADPGMLAGVDKRWLGVASLLVEPRAPAAPSTN